MSHRVNENLFTKAAECIDYFEGKLPAIMIEYALKENNLEMLRQRVTEAWAEMQLQESHLEPEMEETDVY